MSNSLAIVPRTLEEATGLSAKAIASGMFSAYKKPEEALIVILTGAEYGIHPMAALRSFHVINGKACPSAGFMQSLVMRSGLCEDWIVEEKTAERVVITTKRKGQSRPQSVTWTMAMAQQAGVAATNPTWKKYPSQMLYARAAAELARQAYPDVVAGLYTPEEIESVGSQEPVHASIEIVEPDTFDPERDAIQSEQPTLAQRIRDASTLDQLRELSVEARQIPKGHPERQVIAALLTERKSKMEAANG